MKILTQGIFDGFCLHYSIFNAFKALNSPSSSAIEFSANHLTKWEKMIGLSPSLQSFASGEGSDFGPLRDVTDVQVKRNFIASCFNVVNEKNLKKDYRPSSISLDDLWDVDFQSAVVILCLQENAVLEHPDLGDHWVTIIGKDDETERFLIACSYTPHLHNDTEEKDTVTKRYFNNSIRYAEIQATRIYPDSIQLIEVSDRKS